MFRFVISANELSSPEFPHWQRTSIVTLRIGSYMAIRHVMGWQALRYVNKGSKFQSTSVAKGSTRI
jgi:hypothetical protein